MSSNRVSLYYIIIVDEINLILLRIYQVLHMIYCYFHTSTVFLNGICNCITFDAPGTTYSISARMYTQFRFNMYGHVFLSRRRFLCFSRSYLNISSSFYQLSQPYSPFKLFDTLSTTCVCMTFFTSIHTNLEFKIYYGT